ncbi:hypothetical protein [Erwinia amylovora]|uniref:Uncharacterized protein n=2 Tax=Erwinia amylovora TaxID=552 RepID=A0A831ERG4_ERWAM|nr:hypothetical protein [Erwinia amylovora]EKV55107.1 hypothetical protein EaACW_0832 [Erwinia amylovora ACW56400]CBA19774.1 hypothetical protein predicted by Glimmer/Critica [Erwinia amylovora CFBP1430]CCO77678.1 hypothetical protein BN432_0855 [Erwinia amylovora Ea356]CCO85264.1 hypothetical protein BN434_0851 [Erwinia amylovora CFBP 2585]CCO92806.1 hypothetical protein BN437_0850 [Erwinia amylovora NBRC 12687 = CFBP 1232]CCO98159.1 hypothetical protein BN438_0851 [Erwinia amylovora UPN527]
MVRKNRPRDSDGFSIIDGEWPALINVLRYWLLAENREQPGQQRALLSMLMRSIRG